MREIQNEEKSATELRKKNCNSDFNHDYSYFGNVIEYDYFAFLTN